MARHSQSTGTALYRAALHWFIQVWRLVVSRFKRRPVLMPGQLLDSPQLIYR
jgi:hypothetical protein